MQKAKLRRVGNIIGLTIPASELRAMDAASEVELKKVIRSVRGGWSNPEQWHGALLLDVEPVNDYDDKDWQW